MGALTEIIFSAQFLIAVLVAVSVFATIFSVMAPMIGGSELKARMKTVAIERDEMRARERARLAGDNKVRVGLRYEEEKGGISDFVSRLDLKKALADDATIAQLRAAGFRGQRPLTIFLFARFVLPFGMMAFAGVYIFGLGLLADKTLMLRICTVILAGGVGFYLPNLYVKNMSGKRQASIQRAWPDALDLLLICVESGMSIEAAFRRVSQEIGIQSIELAEEMVLVGAELSYLQERRQAYENLGMRTGLDTVKSVCQALIQAERYGTPLGSALRVLAQESRELRMNAAEKKAAALPPKLTVPMILFFLPVLFAVILGPASMEISRSGAF